MGAFRTADGAEVLEAPTREGVLRLEIAPRYTSLTAGATQVVVSDGFVTVTDTGKKKPRRASWRLGGGLIVARAIPREDLGIWLELSPGTMRRIFGVAPRDLYTDDGLDALRALDRLSAQLRQTLGSTRRAFEIGGGLDKVLVTDDGDTLVVHARRLFSDVAKNVLAVGADGTITIPRRRGDLRFRLHERFGVTVTGDLIRFIDREGTDLWQVALHWIFPEDREELARKLGDMIERQVPPDEARAHAHATDARVRLRGRLLARVRASRQRFR